MSRVLPLLTNLFPVWILLGGVVALIHPPAFTWFRGNAIVWGLGVIMLGMGMTLSLQDFQRALEANAQEIFADIPNFTNVEPVVQINESFT